WQPQRDGGRHAGRNPDRHDDPECRQHHQPGGQPQSGHRDTDVLRDAMTIAPSFMTSRPAIRRLLPAALCVGMLASCSSLNSMMGGSSEQSALKDLKWSYAADGVQIAVTADPQLNRSTDQPHTLALTVVQLADPNAFTAATANTA